MNVGHFNSSGSLLFSIKKTIRESEISIPVNTDRLEFHTRFYIAEHVLNY